ncbi:AN1-type zinc finger protein 6 [Drosophila tropicalis]|uniref:AN1-type zinc finger protein 6 n=1 Tax=Drosophila tropicalis TaxID=46794 RepID=UPI0035ABC332
MDSVSGGTDDCRATNPPTTLNPMTSIAHDLCPDKEKDEPNNEQQQQQQKEEHAKGSVVADEREQGEQAEQTEQQEHIKEQQDDNKDDDQDANKDDNKDNNQNRAVVKEPKKRCDKCGKKLGLIGGFPCRCGGTFCGFHRYSDRHECNFDYREMGASEIRRDNPVIVASKLRKL